MRRVIPLLVTVLALQTARGNDLSRIYEPDTLEQARPDLERTTRKILDQGIWPVLEVEEKRQLGGKPPLAFPLYGEEEARMNPLSVYAHYGRREIVYPVLSLKFLEDLCTAYAWLQLNGYGVETVSEYTAILRYKEEPPGGFPPPLQALGIPADARADSRVDELARAHFVTARLFILLHEMNHLMQQRAHGLSAPSIEKEKKADRFAITVMQRADLPPIGVLVFFMVDAHWSSYPQNEKATHPLTGERVRALADAVEDPDLKKLFQDLGSLLDDRDIRTGFVSSGQTGDLAALAPRHPGELPRLQHSSTPSTHSVTFDGVYRGELTQSPDPAPVPMEMVLERTGSEVRGRYNFGLGIGTIEGTVDGDSLSFQWQWGINQGEGVLKSQGKDALTGTWGYQLNKTGAGTWTGHRVR
ncbi:hypothetical protein JRI60_42860 [Archangium violaceum]|uniref:M48 family metalloprotease n=1 Tax=Archangium violaceum TaxID=83451 RepID=UPI00194F5997|nr:M48 family metalloprotease [Archangium violaceum]QRN95725.1 hypothetical protein JRI60_42860 [Archangium violaceum]